MASKLIEGMEEALAVAKGEQPAARMHIRGHAYVPEAEITRLTLSRDGYARDAAARAKECDRLNAELTRLRQQLEACREALTDAAKIAELYEDALASDAADESYIREVRAKIARSLLKEGGSDA
jgi:hypothetical protein